MEEFEKIYDANIVSNTVKVDYYTKTSQKVGDFLLGLFGFVIIYFLLFLISVLSFGSSLFYNIGVIIYLLSIFIFFRINRRFIAIGMLSIFILVVLIFGGCLLLLSLG